MTASPSPGRRAALAVLRRLRAGDLADRAWARAAEALDSRERAWARELVYGTLRLRGRLDHRLERLVRGGLERLHPDVLDVLRLGAYQIGEMGGVPPYAAVSQSVELTRAAGHPRAAGLVNGVLQSLLRAGEVPFPDARRDSAGYLAKWGSHPRWLVDRWLERWGAAETCRLVEQNNRVPELFIRPLGTTPTRAAELLREAGVTAEPVLWAPDSLRLAEPAQAAAALERVPAVVQDPAASWVSRYAEIPTGARVLDLCAAPGGKTLVAAETASQVLAADLSQRRLQRVRENVNRIGWGERVSLVVADARRPPFVPTDVVLLDAPCLGSGTFRRHPDGRWRVTEADLAGLADLQADLLRSAAPLVRPGGWLVYSTCSLEPEENEVQIARFLDEHRSFGMHPPAGLPSEVSGGDGSLLVLPQRTGSDGAFAVRLRRQA